MYTNIPKPTDSTYTKVRNGYPLYDDNVTNYDDISVFYDGDSTGSYIGISKPGYLIWSQATFPWAEANVPWNAQLGYRNVNKPT